MRVSGESGLPSPVLLGLPQILVHDELVEEVRDRDDDDEDPNGGKGKEKRPTGGVENQIPAKPPPCHTPATHHGRGLFNLQPFQATCWGFQTGGNTVQKENIKNSGLFFGNPRCFILFHCLRT